MNRLASTLALLLLAPSVCVAQGEGRDSVSLSGTWEGSTTFVATWHGNGGPAPRFERGDRLELVTRKPYQDMYLLDDEVLFDAPAGESVEQALQFVCGTPNLSHPNSAGSTRYRLSRSEGDVAKEIRALLEAWRGLGRAGSLTPDAPTAVSAQWAVWARAGLEPADLKRTALLHQVDRAQALASAARIGTDVAAILDRAKSARAGAWRKGLEGLGGPGRLPILPDTWLLWLPVWKPPQAGLTLTHIKFDHKGPNAGTSDGLNIRKSFKKDLDHSGNGAGEGEWIAPAVRNEAALYVVNKTVTIKARFKAPVGTLTARIKATTTGFPGVKVKVINFDPNSGISNPEYVELELTRKLGDKIRKAEFTWKWLALEIDGQAQPEASQEFASSGQHTAYVVLGPPGTPWYRGVKTHPWVSALEFTIATANTQGLKTPKDAVKRLTGFVWSGYGLLYDTVRGKSAYVPAPGDTVDLTNFMTKASGNIVNCHDCAGTVWTMSNLLGVGAAYVVTRSFGYLSRTDLIGRGTVNTPQATTSRNPLDTCTAPQGLAHHCDDDIQTDAPPHKRVPFTEHSIVVLGGADVYDACVGPHLGNPFPAYAAGAIDTSSARERNNVTTGQFRGGRLLLK